MKNKLLSSIIITSSGVGLTILFMFFIFKMANAGRDYQLEIKAGKVEVWDKSRLVGTCALNQIDSLIIDDNR